MAIAYRFIDIINPDFVTIHNDFNFDSRRIICCAVDSDILSNALMKRPLGNSDIGVLWKLTDGTMSVDRYYVDRNWRLVVHAIAQEDGYQVQPTAKVGL